MSDVILAEKLQVFLQKAVDDKVAPGLVVGIFNSKKTLATAAAGVKSVETHESMTMDTVGMLASMSKAVASLCALVLVEKYKFDIDSIEALQKVLPEFTPGSGSLVTMLFDKKDADGKWTFKKATKGVTLRHLLTHTAGFGADFLNHEVCDITEPHGPLPPLMSCKVAALNAPRLSEAGEQWHYGISADWVAQFIIRISGMTLRQAQQHFIFTPLGIPPDTLDSFRTPNMNAQRAAVHFKVGEGQFVCAPPELDAAQFENEPPEGFATLGSGCLHGTIPAYCIFLRALLNHGGGLISKKLWDEATSDNLERMGLSLPTKPLLDTTNPQILTPVVGHYMGPSDEGKGEGWTALQTVITRSQSRNGAKVGSLAWAGIANTYFWVDPASGLGGCIMAQFLPFAEPGMLKLKGELEKLVYDHGTAQ